MKLNKIVALSTLALPMIAFADDSAVAAAAATAHGLGYLAAGLGIGLAASVVGYSQSRAAAAALDGMARNPAASKTLFVPLLLCLALMESLVLFAFLITSNLAGK